MISYNYYEDKLKVSPNNITVFKGSEIRWKINYDSLFRSNVFNRITLKWTLYFENNSSPFNWMDKSTVFHNSSNYSDIIELATGFTEKIGEYKYGVKVSYQNSNDPLFDEDPVITVTEYGL